MIVKIKNSREGWTYIECQIIHSSYVKSEECSDIGDCLVLMEDPSSIKKGTEVKRLNLETQKSHLRKIITDRAVYILNDQGKTIDRL